MTKEHIFNNLKMDTQNIKLKMNSKWKMKNWNMKRTSPKSLYTDYLEYWKPCMKAYFLWPSSPLSLSIIVYLYVVYVYFFFGIQISSFFSRKLLLSRSRLLSKLESVVKDPFLLRLISAILELPIIDKTKTDWSMKTVIPTVTFPNPILFL
jgi:hypothetical protein